MAQKNNSLSFQSCLQACTSIFSKKKASSNKKPSSSTSPLAFLEGMIALSTKSSKVNYALDPSIAGRNRFALLLVADGIQKQKCFRERPSPFASSSLFVARVAKWLGDYQTIFCLVTRTRHRAFFFFPHRRPEKTAFILIQKYH